MKVEKFGWVVIGNQYNEDKANDYIKGLLRLHQALQDYMKVVLNDEVKLHDLRVMKNNTEVVFI